ncbi:hypothetical protein HY771_01595 [Candidatus Uhrbacteria bacterium]|nr:hypothetical protein [Candidatus Uhrbacteria bacterium]
MPSRFKQRFVSRLIKDERGAVALIVMVIFMAVLVLVVSRVALTGLDELAANQSAQIGTTTILSAESCAEEALLRLSRDNSYAGGSLTVGEVACTISVSGTPCGSCTVDVTASASNYTRRIQADVSVTGPAVNVVNWKEIE